MGADLVMATRIEGLSRCGGGRFCDLYALDHDLLLVALDRVAVGEHPVPTGIPEKGRVACQLAAFWLDATRNLAPSHFVSDDIEQIRRRLKALEARLQQPLLEGRALLVNRARPFRVACTVIGYRDGEPLAQPLFRPRRKDDPSHALLSQHDLQHAVEPGHARRMEAFSLALYDFARRHARERAGLRLTEATFEFGLLDGTTVVIGLPLTPDTCRFEEARATQQAGPAPDFAREFIDDYLQSIQWAGSPPIPPLPDGIVSRTQARWRELFTRLTGAEPV